MSIWDTIIQDMDPKDVRRMISGPSVRERIWESAIPLGLQGAGAWLGGRGDDELSDEEEEEKARLLQDRARSQRLEDESYGRQLEKYNKITRHQLGGQEQAIKRYHDMFGLTPDPESFPSQAPLEEFMRPGYDQWGKPLPGSQAANQRYQALLDKGGGGSPLAGTELDLGLGNLAPKKEGGGKLSTLLKWGLPAAGIALALGGFGVPGFKFLGPAAGGIGKFLFGTGGGGAAKGPLDILGNVMTKPPAGILQAGKALTGSHFTGGAMKAARGLMNMAPSLGRLYQTRTDPKNQLYSSGMDRSGAGSNYWQRGGSDSALYSGSRPVRGAQTRDVWDPRRANKQSRPFGTFPDPLGSYSQTWDQ